MSHQQHAHRVGGRGQSLGGQQAHLGHDLVEIAHPAGRCQVQATEDDKLYGSVTPAQVAEALAKEGIEIERDAVLMPESIKELGVYSVDVRLHADVQAGVKVWVVRA